MAASLSKHEPSSGRLWVEGDRILQSSPWFGEWTLSIDRIRLIGESTDDSGPWGEDWVLWFAAGVDQWYAASMYSEGHRSVLEVVDARLGGLSVPQLARSTTLASRIMWPRELVDEPLFESQLEDARSAIEWLAHRVCGRASVRQYPSARVRAMLWSKLDGESR